MITNLFYRPYRKGRKAISKEILNKYGSSLKTEFFFWVIIIALLMFLLPLNYTTAGYCFICYIMAMITVVTGIADDLYPDYMLGKVLKKHTYRDVSLERTKGWRIIFSNGESKYYSDRDIIDMYIDNEFPDLDNLEKYNGDYKTINVDKVQYVPDSNLKYTDDFTLQKYVIKAHK